MNDLFRGSKTGISITKGGALKSVTFKLFVRKIPQLKFFPLPVQTFSIITQEAVTEWKQRTFSGVLSDGRPTKKLGRRYAKQKKKIGQPGIRNHFLTGKTFKSFQLRTVTIRNQKYNTRGTIESSTRHGRMTLRSANKKDPRLVQWHANEEKNWIQKMTNYLRRNITRLVHE